MQSVLVVGCGYVGLATARLFHQAGWTVTGVTRSEHPGEEPFPIVSCDIGDREAVGALPKCELIIDCVSSGRGGAETYQRVYLEGARNLLELLAPKRLIFTSSSSVYAQTEGQWVDENSPAEPDRETGRILRQTEELVLSHGGIVARLAGIYGPGRSVLLRKFLDGTAVIEGDGERYINQIHRDDAAAALLLLAENGSGIYNVCDSEPLLQRDCYQWLADHFQRPPPPYGPIDLGRKRGWTNKRVSNRRLRELGWECKFPSFLKAVAAGLEV